MTAPAHSIDLVSPQVLVRITLRVINPTVRGPLLSTSYVPCTHPPSMHSATAFTDTPDAQFRTSHAESCCRIRTIRVETTAASRHSSRVSQALPIPKVCGFRNSLLGTSDPQTAPIRGHS